jgi:hypothetical protein
MTQLLRKKFNIDYRKFNYSALIRSNQMQRDEALNRTKQIYVVEDPKVIDLCIKRLGLKKEDYINFLDDKPKTFRDYDTNYNLIKLFKYPIKILSKSNFFHPATYYKFFGVN